MNRRNLAGLIGGLTLAGLTTKAEALQPSSGGVVDVTAAPWLADPSGLANHFCKETRK
jgi:hypothetical protein